MVLLAFDTFTGTTGAAWSSQWTNRKGTQTIQANTGQLTAATTTVFDDGRADLTGMTVSDAYDLTVTLAGTVSAVEQFAGIHIAGSGDVVPGDVSAGWYPHTGYVLELHFAATAASSTVGLYSLDAGPQTSLATLVTMSLTGTTRYSVRIQKLGATIRAKVWTGNEPDAWTIAGTATNTYSGIVGLTVGNGGVAAARSFQFDDLYVTNGLPAQNSRSWAARMRASLW